MQNQIERTFCPSVQDYAREMLRREPLAVYPGLSTAQIGKSLTEQELNPKRLERVAIDAVRKAAELEA
jgi:hypothetical protein